MSEYKQGKEMTSQSINNSMYDTSGRFPEIMCPVCKGEKSIQIGTTSIPCWRCKGRGTITPVFEENA